MHPFRPEPDLKTETRWDAFWRRWGPRVRGTLFAAVVLATLSSFIWGPPISRPNVVQAAEDSGVAAESGPATAPATAVDDGSTTAGGLPDTAGLVATGTMVPDGPVGPGTDMVTAGSILVQLLMAKEYKLAAGALLMILLALGRGFWSRVPEAWRPSVVILSGAIATTATGLLAGVDVWPAIWNGVSTAGVAAGLYEILRPLLAKIPKVGALFEKRSAAAAEPKPTVVR